MTHTIYCKKSKKESESLDKPPFPGELGQQIYNNISKEAWKEWFDLQTKMINEYRLDMHNDAARDFLKEEMKKFLNLI